MKVLGGKNEKFIPFSVYRSSGYLSVEIAFWWFSISSKEVTK